MPAFLGEKDVIKALKILPGVQQGMEGSTALYVRGGTAGQNLIILDEATVYNANHLFGFFSTFNGDAIKKVEFYKSGFPAKYGGRASSVINLQMKDGNKENVTGEGGIGLVSSRFTLEGPIRKNKASFLLSARRTYLDAITRPFMSDDSFTKYRFYDINAKINYNLNQNNAFFLSGYFGNDKLSIIEDSQSTQSKLETSSNLAWGNSTLSFRWNHVFNDKLFLNTTLLRSHYRFQLTDKYQKTGIDTVHTDSNYRSSVRYYSVKMDFDYFISNNHSMNMGILLTHHRLQPRENTFLANQEITTAIQIKENQEFAAYAEDHWKLSKKTQINLGIRFSGLRTGTKTYYGLGPRINLIHDLPNGISVKASYTRMNQYLHLLSNTGAGLPTDLWVPPSHTTPPQQTDQIAIGISKAFKNPEFSLSVESYRKYLNHIIAYTDDATFLSVDEGGKSINFEEGLASGKGWAYGTEILLTKDQGRISYSLGYAISWAVHQFDGLNYGKKFFPQYDSRHNISALAIYKISPKITLSANWTYHSGNALTVPRGYYDGNFALGTESETDMERIKGVSYFGAKNSFRGEDYHRLDISIQFHKKKRKYERYWEVGIFNLYNRKNPFYYYLETSNDFVNRGQKIELKKKSLFPILPSISYNIKF